MGKGGRIWLYGEVRGSSLPQVNVNQLAHDLAVAEVLVILVEELRGLDPAGELQITWDWWSEAEARIIKDETVIVEPDVLLRVGSPAAARANFYLEVDRATERGKAFINKIKRYHSAYRSRVWQDDFEAFPVIFIVTTSAERVVNLARQVADFQSEHRRADIMWAVTPLSIVQAQGLFQATWTIVQQDRVLSGKRIGLRLA